MPFDWSTKHMLDPMERIIAQQIIPLVSTRNIPLMSGADAIDATRAFLAQAQTDRRIFSAEAVCRPSQDLQIGPGLLGQSRGVLAPQLRRAILVLATLVSS